MGPGELQHARLDGGQIDGNLCRGRWHKARIILDVKELPRIGHGVRRRAGPHGADALNVGDPVAYGQKTAVRGKCRFCTATVSSLLAQEGPLIRGSLRLSSAIKKGVEK